MLYNKEKLRVGNFFQKLIGFIMGNLDFISQLINLLLPYDLVDLISKVGALQLCPENLDHSTRIDLLLQAINFIKYVPNKPKISHNKFKHICNNSPLGNDHITAQEDRSPNIFTESFSFFGDNFIVFPGQLCDPTFILRNMISAIFLSSEFINNKVFLDEIYCMTRGILEISDRVAKKAGLIRNMPPSFLSKNIHIPDNFKINQSAIIFSLEEFEEIVRIIGLKPSILKRYINQFDDQKVKDNNLHKSLIQTKPMIKINEQIIVAEPWALLDALQNQILLTAKKFNVLNKLNNQYYKEVLYNINTSMEKLGHKQIDYRIQSTNVEINIAECLWKLDNDKILYTGILMDNFSDFSENDSIEECNLVNEGELLDKHLPIIEEQILTRFRNVEEIFFIIVNAGIGRTKFIGLQLDSFKIEPLLLILSAADLEILSYQYLADTLVLYKFAKAQNNLHKNTKVISWSTLDEFELYRKNQDSFYLSDDPRPTLLNIDPGLERKIKIEVLTKFDFHGVPSYQPLMCIDVMNVYHEPTCPIYTPKNMPFHQMSIFVETSPINYWIITEFDTKYFGINPLIPNPGEFVNLVSYWIWQFNEEISTAIGNFDFVHPVTIKIELDENEQWSMDYLKKHIGKKPLSTKIISEYSIYISLKPNIINIINSETNSGELQIMHQIFGEICNLLVLHGYSNQAKKMELVLQEIVYKQGLIPTKKLLIGINLHNNPTLLPVNYYRFRKIQDSDISTLLDDAGLFLELEHNLSVGNIPKENYSLILNSLVSYYFQRLAKIISGLEPDFLLEFLVSNHEAIICERSIRGITIATQAACFSSIQELSQQLVKQIPDFDNVALACRFLIEYVISQPPKGEKHISYTIYDQIMALASEIISRGNQSDLSKYGLVEFNLRFLGSKRLGLNTKDINSKMASFNIQRSKSVIQDTKDNFYRWWVEKPQTNPSDYPPQILELNNAFKAEFGLLLSDVFIFLFELGNSSLDFGTTELKSKELNQLISEISSELNWTSEKVEQFIDFLSLTHREIFLNPPTPYKLSDIYPWRMSRGLSYMRRPLFKVIKNDQIYAKWGFRQLFASAEYLLDATISGRLQDEFKSKEMREYLGKVHGVEGEEFNNDVYQSILKLQNVIVYKKVKKIDGYRIGSPENDLGDVDVLAFFLKTKTICIIECKNLEIARNAIEMSREMETLIIGNSNKESTISKHLKRVNWIKRNMEGTLKFYGIKEIKKWKVVPLIVVSSEMMTPHFNKSPIPIYSFSSFISNYLPKHQ